MRIMFNDVIDFTKKVIYNVSFAYPDVIQDVANDRYVVRFRTLTNEDFVIFEVRDLNVNGLTESECKNICKKLLEEGYLNATKYVVFRDVD